MTIREKVNSAVNIYVAENGYETWMSGDEIKAYVNSCFKNEQIKDGSFLPTDYCYNRYNIGLKDFENKDRVLEYNDGQFRLLGENYPYTGDAWHYPRDKSIDPYIVGRWIDGKFGLYSDDTVEEIKEEKEFSKESVSIANDIEKELDLEGLEGEERLAVAKIRANQSIYRKALLRKYKTCCLCGVANTDLLIASHIKPWNKSESVEKLDAENGLLLCPNHDKLFDRGYISFDDQGNIMISSKLNDVDRVFTNVNEKMKIAMSRQCRDYMNYHRTNVYKG